MFTIHQIQQAHSRVKTGADFPSFIQDIKTIGVTKYETYVTDGHTLYYGNDGYKIQSDAKYGPLEIAAKRDKAQFEKNLKEHQQKKTDYPTFCRASAESGVKKWIVDLAEMTCTYYDNTGNSLLVEEIPRPSKVQ